MKYLLLLCILVSGCRVYTPRGYYTTTYHREYISSEVLNRAIFTVETKYAPGCDNVRIVRVYSLWDNRKGERPFICLDACGKHVILEWLGVIGNRHYFKRIHHSVVYD